MRRIFIIVGILVVVGLGFWFLSNMTGGVVSGVDEEVVVNEYFSIDGVDELNDTEVLNGTSNISGSG